MNLEDELRSLLRAKADGYAPLPQGRTSIVTRARIRLLRRSSATMLVLAGASLLATTLAIRLTPGEGAFAALDVRTRPHLGSHATRPRGHDETPSHAAPGQPITLAMLKKNVQCMRDHGFDLPDPVKTAHGWQVIVEDSSPLPSESPDYNVRQRWAQAVFVDCRLMDPTGDLVLGGRTRQQIAGLMACARAQGFVLPTPTETKRGEFEFDLSVASPRWGSQAWYQTVFVRCGLWRHGPESTH
jgi:hypothetical protein